MNIHIEDLKFKCIIGILEFERDIEQDVIIDIKIEYEYIDQFIDYADITKIIKKDMINTKFLLIEDALEGLSKKLKKNFPLIKQLYLKISKPSILPDCKVSVANNYKFNS
jgi:dihydroneopterin aldolase